MQPNRASRCDRLDLWGDSRSECEVQCELNDLLGFRLMYSFTEYIERQPVSISLITGETICQTYRENTKSPYINTSIERERYGSVIKSIWLVPMMVQAIPSSTVSHSRRLKSGLTLNHRLSPDAFLVNASRDSLSQYL